MAQPRQIISTSKRISTKALADALIRMGFTEISPGYTGIHRIFEHHSSGLKVTVPRNREPIRPVHLSAIRRQISNFEIASDEKFDRRVLDQDSN
jgi:predicted RNA binding protein YcfA (HicA-like mRNA interferase family)